MYSPCVIYLSCWFGERWNTNYAVGDDGSSVPFSLLPTQIRSQAVRELYSTKGEFGAKVR